MNSSRARLSFSAVLVSSALALMPPPPALAQENTEVPSREIAARPSAPAQAKYVPPPFFSTLLPREPNRPRAYLLPPVLSFVLPGWDQWWEGQYGPAVIYSGTALGGLGIAADAMQRLEARHVTSTNDLSSRDNDVRSLNLGSQLYMAAGSYSAYASFRAAARTRQPQGEFSFLKSEETTDDLLLAPFSFSHLKKPSTFVPLLLILTAIGADLSNQDVVPEIQQQRPFDFIDAGFASSFSYLAGTNEEALFRGFMMPVYMNAWDSPFWANTAQATIFAAAHISGDNPVPWPQLLLGWYLGHVSQTNGWTLSESVFIHTWWDVIAFTGTYLHESREKSKEAWLWLPVVKATF